MRRGVRPVAWMVALALHVLVALLMVWQAAPRKAAAPVKRVIVRLLALPAIPERRTVPLPTTPSARLRHSMPGAAKRAAPDVQDTTITPSLSTPAPADEAREPNAVHNPVTQPPLSLALPASSAASSPRSMVNAALNDPRSNTRRMTPSERFAATLGTNTAQTEERIVDGVRIRRGNSCVLVHESKGSFIDPFNQSGRPMPKMAEKCP